jgi:parallel beta-helix repeat protein
VGGDYENNESYGIFPILSDNGRIASNHVSGSSDSGIYVGQSSHSTVVDNVCVNNTVGIEVENASSVAVMRNALHGNSIGILAVVLPNLTVKTTSGIDVDLNVVRNNNRENSTTEPGDPLALLPGGVGVLLVGADQTRVSANRVLNNGSAGIAVVSLPHKFAKLDRLIDPAPDRDSITANTVLGNGRQPDPRLGALPPRDLLYRRSYELTFRIQGWSQSERSRPGSATSRFHAAQQASTMAR